MRTTRSDPTSNLIISLYTGYAVLAAAAIFTVTLVAGFSLHTLVAPRVAGTTWTAPIEALAGLAQIAVLTGIVLLIIYGATRAISIATDKIFAQSLNAPNGRKLTGILGVIATGALAAIWALPMWESVAPSIAARATATAPATLPGDIHTFATTVPVLGAVYAYFATTGGDYTTPDTADFASNSDTPDYTQSAPTTPRTTETTTSPSTRRNTQQSWGNTSSTSDDSDTADESSSSDTSNTDGDDGTQSDPETGAGTEDDAESETPEESVDAPSGRAEFERKIQQQETSTESENAENTETATTDVDLSDAQFDWVSATNVTMDDVGGMEDVKEEVHQDIIKPMKEEPEKAERFDIPLPNMLLYGPPGTGKTYLAKALATELGFPFVDLSGSDITSKWVNESSEKVGSLFEEAEGLAGEVGGAVIFLDELDAVLPERQGDSHEENRKVVNEFLSHLQESSRKRVLFVGATNKRDDLDSAATRNGRIDKEVFVGEPDREARVAIFHAQLDGRPHTLDEEDIEELAEVTDDVVAADIEAIVNQAARNAAYGRDADHMEWEDFEMAIDDI